MQCSVVQFIAVQCSAVQCSAVQCSAVYCSVVQCSAVQWCPGISACVIRFACRLWAGSPWGWGYITGPYNTLQQPTPQYSTLPYTTVQYIILHHSRPESPPLHHTVPSLGTSLDKGAAVEKASLTNMDSLVHSIKGETRVSIR